ncbi:pimeloyl-ACP methyl ester carboxylesterase [Algoriphagus sp. 4150]|uniref:alpha/beta fold hydrolase n=1 Tax=Algoriphagus sp. 4150 TaxID=2817756 RepID=UPI002863179C|nr:hypothetical protein [Algoriphagus sp. 4150]MDR7131472.1 pimeloyl-ACP methyl ester carboxylesterase [Algoriphagus sp. 4150]
MTGLKPQLFVFGILILSYFSTANQDHPDPKVEKPTLLVLGGTPSTMDIIDQLPASIRESYQVISFNRPGFGGTVPSEMTKEKLFELAKNAGLKKNDFGVIGISGGAPLAILLADEFNLKHCGVISGMVSNEAYFRFAELTFTADFFIPATQSYEQFAEVVMGFPNLEAIVTQAGAETREEALLASYNELNFILSEDFYSTLDNREIPIVWWHGENDKNVALQSVELFLKDFKNATLHVISDTDHEINAIEFMELLLSEWN